MTRKFALIIYCIALIVIAAGCADKKQTVPNPPEEPAGTLMNDFYALAQKGTVEEVAGFINHNISNSSKEDAAKMVDEFEKIQKKNLPEFESMYNKDDIQKKIYAEYKSITAQSGVKDAGLKELLAKTKNSGYKVETAEGFFFPIIDYGFYKNFSPYVTPDMKDYIDIMAEESDRVPAKDAALIIGWDEIITRALNQEKFINTHKDSMKIDDMGQLYKKYVTFVLYGLNNTPLFSYDTKTLNPKARDVYLKAAANPGSSELLTALGGFLDLLEKTNYKLTDEVDQYRGDISKRLGDRLVESSRSSAGRKIDAQATLLNEIVRLARQGKVINCGFPVEATVIEEVKEKWGDPDQADYIPAAKGTYAVYSKHSVVFGYNKGLQIFDVRSYHDSLNKITMSRVKEVLGAPENTHHFNAEDMLVYNAGEKYQLLFLFPKATRQNSDPQLDHYNVFYPVGSVNMMADDPGIKY